jgi:hypothetical protein
LLITLFSFTETVFIIGLPNECSQDYLFFYSNIYIYKNISFMKLITLVHQYW